MIEAYAFDCCYNLEEVLIPESVTSLGGTVFRNCYSLRSVKLSGSYAPTMIEVSKENFTYNGKAQKISITVMDSRGNLLVDGVNYEVSSPKPIKSVGNYTVKIIFKGNYDGVVKKEITIVPKGTSISKLMPKKKGFTVKWKKQNNQTTGYEIAYSTDSKFSKKNTKTVSVGKNTTTSKAINKIKAKKKYYVRIRTYKTVKGKKYYSDWSNTKNIITKK